MIHLRFPAASIAKWTGHTLTVQEQHYCEEGYFLPSAVHRDYGRFGSLSEYGKRCLQYASQILGASATNGAT
jgi:hypothetical protein